ncbi:DNA polymerase epsilon catalytic subunit [Martiniozyma asiatica (nom. inval.)]|nr:DNA polymerase epsilon catalytic subunit [Martiniozyma asiatica]
MSSRGNFKGSTSARYVKNVKGVNNNNNEPNYNDFSRNKSGQSKAQQLQSEKFQHLKEVNRIDSIFGFDKYESGPKKCGWMVNMHPTLVQDEETHASLSGVDYYFLDEEGGSFKVSYTFDPYFLIICPPGKEPELEEWLRRTLEKTVKSITRTEREDLELENHLVGKKRSLVKLSFNNISELLDAKRELTPFINKNKETRDSADIYKPVNLNYNSVMNNNKGIDDLLMDVDQEDTNDFKYNDASELMLDMREYDVPYHVRVNIDEDLRIGKWYYVEATPSGPKINENKDKIAFADPVVLAFDIETTKAPLKFPDPSIDQVMMISYMIDGDGYLITNRSIISEDIEDFEYTPKPEYPGEFTIFNESDEKALLERFFEHVREVRPTVIATFNGDFFDWPFVENRASYHGLDMFKEIGFAKDSEDEYKSSYCVHMDCFRWVKRDSYLPQGSQGLKAVTTAKLGYNPTELDPELMTPYAYEHPQLLAEYSVSDAVATYYLYYKYVHPFIFSLGTIIPLNPDEVLRKGTGTLCEMLLMVQAYQGNILLPNKHTDPPERFYNGHLLESETYVGGHVESLEAGVFRSDLQNDFEIDPTAVDEIVHDLDAALKFAITVEGGKNLEDITNYDEVYEGLKNKLLALKEKTKRTENPLIYHVDVASMYPNIMTTNRLQPDSMKTEQDCATCDFNRPGKKCDRRLTWAWRGEFYPADMSEYNMIKNAMNNESFPSRFPGGPKRKFDELPYSDQVSHLKKKVSDYSRKVYHRIKTTETVEREAIVCQRENPFYVDTVRRFRDRRYDFKGLAKDWKGKVKKIDPSDHNAIDEAQKMVVLYDSLQLAHKVILNSFYGYVMRKGSRWYSMEMAGITCLTGSTIIQMARTLVQRLGRCLEIDTDGIWCILPSSFPEYYDFKLKNGKTLNGSYPCSMVNYLVHQKFTNKQYQTLIDTEKFKYEVKDDNSIFFEVDGPYKAMILPTSKEEGKGLKKRYAVFNFDGSLAELKGFELKRRGELQLIKNFQSDIFKLFLDGDTLEGCYQAVANVANRWLDVLDTKGKMLEDEDLIELICENRSMSKKLAEYGDQKSTSITTAKRLGEFLGAEMVKDAGLACKYVIAQKPIGSPVTERAIPTTIFSSEISVKRKFLRRWLKDPSLEDFDPRLIIDWEYYRERLSSVVQKIITIPAALQGVKNPVPRVAHPDWLQRQVAINEDKKKQSNLSTFFKTAPKGSKPIMPKQTQVEDIEGVVPSNGSKIARVTKSGKKRKQQIDNVLEEEEQRLLNGKLPDPLTNYPEFLKYQKVKWKQQAIERARREKIFGRAGLSTGSFAMNNMIKNQADSYLNSIWQVIQYKEDKPGVLKVLVLIKNKVQTVRLTVPKKLYVDFKAEGNDEQNIERLSTIENCKVTKSGGKLPTGSNGEKGVYKLVMPETVFNEEMKKVGGVLTGTDIQGIYESKIASIDRAIIDLGSCVRYDEKQVGSLSRAMEKGFEIKNLKQVPGNAYLDRFTIGVLYLLHIVCNGYEIYTLFNTSENSTYMYVLKPSNGAQELSVNMHNIYKDVYEAKKASVEKLYNIIDYKDELEFETQYFTDINKLYKKMISKINNVTSNVASKMLFIIQSHIATKLANILEINDFPMLNMSVAEVQTRALQWHSMIGKRIASHYLSVATWLKKLLLLSKYTNVPLCNLNVDNMGYLIDIEYSRRLSKNNIVLWWSNSSTPDYGGLERDKLNISTEETLVFPTLNRPEIYESVCLEIEVKNLTINTVLSSALINESEGVFVSESGDSSSGTFAEDSFSGPALAVLRGMIRVWWDDAINERSEADELISAFVKWCANSSSYLYDSSLHYHVHNLTKKSMVQLLSEFKRMGSSIIFADRNRVIVKTSKQQVENSYAYGEYLVSNTRAKPLFNLLELNIVRYWDLLFWMDKYNFAGSFCWEIKDDEQSIEFISKWHIKNFLPAILQDEFEDWINMFMHGLKKESQKILEENKNSTRGTQITQILNSKQSQSLEDDENEPLIKFIRKPLLKRIHALIKKQKEITNDPSMASEYSFPILAGSHLKLTNPTLELVKYLCQILSLSKKRNLPVRMLRRDLLTLFGILEFNEEGIFKNPSTSLITPELICDSCYQTRDLDMCKDDEDELGMCLNCERPYNKLVIEERLIFELKRLVAQYLNQDLICEKCNRMRSDELSPYCGCSGRWIQTVTYKDLVRNVNIFENVSNAYKMSLLREVVKNL